MIGMMNSGGDTPVEFYATHKRPELLQQASLYRRPPPKAMFTYTQDGRHVDAQGNVVEKRSPEEMWSDLIMKMVSTGICRHISVKGGGGKKRRVKSFFLKQKSRDCEQPAATMTTLIEIRPAGEPANGRVSGKERG